MFSQPTRQEDGPETSSPQTDTLFLGRAPFGVSRMKSKQSRLFLSVLLGALALTGCSDDPPGMSMFDGVDVTLPAPEAFPIVSSGACFVDNECPGDTHCFQGSCRFECSTDTDCGSGATCSVRRRCEGAGSRTTANVVPGVGIATPPPNRVRVLPGQNEITLTLVATEAVPAGEIAYSLECFEGITGTRAVDGEVHRAVGTTEFEIVVPTPMSNPDNEESGPALVTIETNIGSFEVVISPQPAVGGTYAGPVTIRELGGVPLSVDLEIVTQPDDVSLAEADTAWLVLPIRNDTLFAPHPVVDGGPEGVAAELTLDTFTGTWVAVFDHSFALTADGPFGHLGEDQIERILRFEITMEDGRVTGQMSDRWSGLFDERSASGVRSPGDVVFQGEVDLERSGPGRGFAELPTPADLPTPAPGPRESPSTLACEAFDLGATADIDVAGVTYSCSGYTDIASFESSVDAESRQSCAIAVAENALAGDTVASQLSAFIGGTAGGSFTDFLDDCVAGTDDTCVPTTEVLCGRQMVANAYEFLTGLSASAPQAIATYRAISREASLGPQLAAFYADTDTRLSWLQSTSFPDIVTSAVQGHSRGLLEDWRDDVLDVHIGVLGDQFSAGSLSMLARGSEIETVNDAREAMLLELSQSWRASADALSLGAARWNELFQDNESRNESATYVRERLFDLYVMAGVLSELNRLAGAGFASSAFVGGFEGIASELSQLSESQSSLIFARDAEVVVSTSLDPMMGTDAVLSSRREAAMTGLAEAAESVNGTLADLQMNLVDEASLRGRTQNQVDTIYDEVVELCGLPIGCTLADRDDPDCRPRVEEGVCGLGIDPTSDAVIALTGDLPSEAGAALLDIVAARNDVAIASAELRAQANSAERYYRLTEDFAARVEGWNASRIATDERVTALLDEAQLRRMEGLESLEQFITQGQAIRSAAANERMAWVADWDTWENESDGDIGSLLQASNRETTAVGLQLTADTLFAASETAFGVAGLSSPLTAAGYALGVVGAATSVAGAGFHVAAGIVQASAASLRDDVDRSMVARDFAMNRAGFTMDLQTAAREDELANVEADMEALATRNDFQDAILETIVDQLEGGLADELAYERDLAELDDRRVELRDRIGELDALRIRQSQARLTILQRILAYHQVVQRARLTEGRLRSLEAQQSELNNLLGSPAVVFGWANRLTQAENRLERAKSAMTEWLVALEYLAVRPFIDQRIQILLARNTFQLEAIAGELDRLQMSCGGALNTTNVEVSVRSDLLGIDRGIVDEATGQELDAAARFRSILASAVVPIDKRVRYTSDGDVGDLVRNGDVQAATFDISLTDFANLEATCNAKVSSIAIELVGADLGTGRPTVSVLYDGASSVRSCQPNITTLVESVGRDATAFGSVTTFRTAGRSVSPVAGINEAGSSNATLQGLPLASQYTVLIDPSIGENGSINWDALEDIVLHIEYVTQDLFPSGQCQ